MSPAAINSSSSDNVLKFASEKGAMAADPTDAAKATGTSDDATDISHKTSAASLASSERGGNMTSLQPTGTSHTTSAQNNSTGLTAPSTSDGPSGDGDNSAGVVVGVILTLLLVAFFIVIVYVLLKRKGKLGRFSFFSKTRPRRSSTSDSRRALEEHEVTDHVDRHEPTQAETDDMFTIEDFEDPNERDAKDEYFYDEVFGHSQFEDEETNKAMRQLYAETRDEHEPEEMLDFDFETLGINIDSYKIDPGKKNVG